ncbi:MAG: NAD-binding protein [Solirubrobacterales bacterium]|nr:NAD-binding protein [Solirubrobacterales bacterium]
MSRGTVAVLGTGMMGAPMVRNLVRAELPVVAWNRTPEKAEALAADGVRVASEPEEALAEAAVLITMLADGPTVESVLGAGDALTAAPADLVWIQTSTVGAAGADRLADLAADHGVEYVDAPVLGSAGPAARGELVILASGPDDARDRCAPAFDAVGKRTVWLGPAGAGSRLKVMVNAWLMAMTTTLAETLALGEKLGVDPEWFFDVTDRGAIAGLYTELNGAAMVAREFPVNFPLELATKDTALALEAAGDGAGLRVLEATLEQFERAERLGLGKSDWAAVIRAAAGDGSPDSPSPSA